MSGDTKDLAYYQQHPDELADLSLEEIEALGAASATEGDTASGKAPEAAEAEQQGDQDGKAAQTQGEGEDAGAEPADSSKDDEPQIDGVLAKDGKNVLPFSVLQGARERAAALEKMVAEQQAELARLRQAQEQEHDPQDEPSDSSQPQAQSKGLTEEALSLVEQEFPALAEILRAQQAELAALREERMARAAAQANAVANEVQNIIDSMPKLAHLQANDADAWRELVEIDDRLRTSPKWQNRPMAERFEAALRIYEAENGDVALPNAPAQASASVKHTQTATQPLDKPATQSRRGPTTLSDLPGGKPAPVDELASIEQASAPELTARFEAMTPEQIEAFILRSGG